MAAMEGIVPVSSSHQSDSNGVVLTSHKTMGERNDGQRQRVAAQSCAACQARKVKCDRMMPSCGWCARNSHDCSYRRKQKPGPKVGHSQELAQKVNQLESVVQHLQKQLADHISVQDDGETAHDDHVSLDTANSLVAVGSPESMVAETTRLSRVGSSAHIQQSELAWHTTSGYSTDTNGQTLAPVNQLSPTMPGPTVGWPSETVEPELPPPQQLYVLVDLYFKHINAWMPMLERGTTFDILYSSSIPDESDRVLLHAIVVVSLRFSRDPRHTVEVQKEYSRSSKRRVQLYGLEFSNIRTLQAMVLLTADMVGISLCPESSNMLAFITQSILNFRLGLEGNHSIDIPGESRKGGAQSYLLPSPISWIEDEERRRLFWVVYYLDRYSSFGVSSKFQIDDTSARRRLPCRYDLFSNNRPVETRWPRWSEGQGLHVEDDKSNLGSFSYHCEVLTIASQTHELMNKPLDISCVADIEEWRRQYSELDLRLSIWLRSLPGDYRDISQLGHSDTKSRISNWILLQAAFILAVIQLHAAAAYPPKSSEFFRPSYNAMQKCLGAVSSLKELTLDVVNSDMVDLLGPGFALALWVATRILLVHASIEGHALDSNVYFFMATLDQISKYWSVAGRYSEILNSAIPGNGQDLNDEGNSLSQLFITKKLSDIRKSAYSLHVAMAEPRNSIQHPSTARTLTHSELLSIDIFGIFNHPNIHPSTPYGTDNGATMSISSLLIEDFEVPDPQNDWYPIQVYSLQ